VKYSEACLVQIDWLRQHWGIDFTHRLEELLSRDPTPHRTRRIRHKGSGVLEIGCGAWRARFRVEANDVLVERIRPGFPLSSLLTYDAEEIPDAEAQREFLKQWSE
jgi:hypothetical protein